MRDAYLALLTDVCGRPDAYVGRANLRSIRLLMDGYEMGLTAAGRSPDLDGWAGWVWLRFGICHPGWWTTRVIIHSHGLQAAAIAAYPGLVRQFLADRNEMGGPAAVRAAVAERFPPGHVRDGPVETDTTAED